MHARSSERLTLDEWLAFDRAHTGPTFFARPAWAVAVAAAHPDTAPAPMMVTLDDGSRVVVPMMESRGRLGWRVRAAMPDGKHSAVLNEDGSAARSGAASAAIRWVVERAGHSVTFTPWPLAEYDLSGVAGRRKRRETWVLDVSGGVSAAVERIDSKARRMAGQAERRGVECARSAGADAVDTYYALLEDSAARWGLNKPTISKRLLREVVAAGRSDVEIWFARYENEAIAGGVVLYGVDEMFYWSAAMRADFGTLRPNNALNVALVRAASDRGVRWYNLGSNEGLPGVARFKASLGARCIQYETIVRESLPYRLYRRVRGGAEAQ